MIEKIGTKGHEIVSEPCQEVLTILKKIKKTKSKSITVGEIGVGIGATSVEILKCLDQQDRFYLFSYENEVEKLLKDLEKLNNKNVDIIGKGNTKRTYDSYSWTLAKMALQAIKDKEEGIFDLVYLDGAHMFIHDAAACCCIKKIMKKGGYIVFDDMYWSIATSPSQNPEVMPEIIDKYTQEQIETCNIEMVVTLFMESDKDYQQIFLTDNRKPYRSIWKKIK